MSLIEHLSELRTRLIWGGIGVVLGCVVSFLFVDDIWQFLVAPMASALEETQRGSMAITEPLEGFMTQLKVAGVSGMALAAPIIFYQGWKFVAPGLYSKEQRVVLPLVFSSSVLFLVGMLFGYTVIFRYAFPFFLEVTPEGVEAVLSINSYLIVATKLLFAFGMCFQLPIVVYTLARTGLIDHRDMIDMFRYAVVAIFVVAALITPPDILSQALMAGPLIFLYGVGILIARCVSTKTRD